MSRPRSRIQYQLAVVDAVGGSPTRLAPRVVPAVDPWLAGEMFFSPHSEERRRGLALLLGSETTRRSPLTPHLLAARLTEPDPRLRAHIGQALADYFEVRERQYRYPPDVRAGVAGCLRQLDRRQLLALLELVAMGELHLASLAQLLERVPDAAPRLARLASDRTVALNLRRAAIELIGAAGMADVVEVLTGLELRLAGRTAGQLSMNFGPAETPDELSLLPTLRAALARLRDTPSSA